MASFQSARTTAQRLHLTSPPAHELPQLATPKCEVNSLLRSGRQICEPPTGLQGLRTLQRGVYRSIIVILHGLEHLHKIRFMLKHVGTQRRLRHRWIHPKSDLHVRVFQAVEIRIKGDRHFRSSYVHIVVGKVRRFVNRCDARWEGNLLFDRCRWRVLSFRFDVTGLYMAAAGSCARGVLKRPDMV